MKRVYPSRIINYQARTITVGGEAFDLDRFSEYLELEWKTMIAPYFIRRRIVDGEIESQYDWQPIYSLAIKCYYPIFCFVEKSKPTLQEIVNSAHQKLGGFDVDKRTSKDVELIVVVGLAYAYSIGWDQFNAHYGTSKNIYMDALSVFRKACVECSIGRSTSLQRKITDFANVVNAPLVAKYNKEFLKV